MPKVTSKKKIVILTGKVRNLGKRGDVVSVKPGYFRNFLSKELAIAYDENKLKEIQATLQSSFDIQHEKEAEKNMNVLNNQCLYFARQASGTDILFASVSKKDIVEKIKEVFNIEINLKKIFIKDFIKKIGVYNISIDLSESISIDMKLSVGQTIENAEKIIKELYKDKVSHE